MIEAIMFVGIGFLLAGLLVIGIIPLVHARAIRLTTRRLEAINPLSMAEVQADKDLLRAEFAMSTYQLEIKIEQMKANATSHLTEIGRRSEAVGRLKLELGEKTAALFALGAKERQLVNDLQRTQADLAAKAGMLEETARVLAGTEADLAAVRANLPASLVEAESNSKWRRLELAPSSGARPYPRTQDQATRERRRSRGA
jgi:hypothetical protein